MTRTVDHDAILAAIADRAAREYLQPHVVRTPVRRLPWLERFTGVPTWAKLEHQQHTGSFKYRGARFRLRDARADVPVISASAGNHGLAVGHAAAELGLIANIVLPTTASSLKRERVLATGAGVIDHGAALDDAIAHARDLAGRHGWVWVSPYDDLDVIAGNATLGWEILEQIPDAATIIVPVGGGGLIAGIGTAVHRAGRSTAVIGCEPAWYASMQASLSDGVARVVHRPTIADGLALNIQPGSVTIPIARALVNGWHALSEEELAAATLALIHHEGLLVEPAGGAAVAACLRLADHQRRAPIVVPLCGGNLSAAALARIQAHPVERDDLLDLLDRRGRTVAAMPVARVREDRRAAGAVDDARSAAASIAQMLDDTRGRLAEAGGALADFAAAARLDGLVVDQALIAALITAVAAAADRLAGVTVGTAATDLAAAEALVRWGLAALAHARRAFEWCSPSYAQAHIAQFFDPAAQASPAANYDRYQHAEVRRIERQLEAVLGIPTEQFAAIVTSSGMAAYTLIEAFLLRERMQPGAAVVGTPYLYFEAQEQLESLAGVRYCRARGYEVDDMLDAVAATGADVVFADAVANTVEQRMVDVGTLIDRIGRIGRKVTLVVDGTMTSGCLPAGMAALPPSVELIYYESCSKYLQLGLDATMGGVVVAPLATKPSLERLRRNLGAIMPAMSAYLFPVYERPVFVGRMRRISANAAALARILYEDAALRRIADVIYPGSPWHVDHHKVGALAWSGGCVTFRFHQAAAWHRDRLESAIERAIHAARAAGLSLTKGVSFGFTIPRISAAASMAETEPPFLRVSAGDVAAEVVPLARILAAALLES